MQRCVKRVSDTKDPRANVDISEPSGRRRAQRRAPSVSRPSHRQCFGGTIDGDIAICTKIPRRGRADSAAAAGLTNQLVALAAAVEPGTRGAVAAEPAPALTIGGGLSTL